MQRKITGFHQDEQQDWVAELDCHHGQHVRHNPPFFNRPWVLSSAGRDSQLGTELCCVRCDRLEFPEGLRAYKRTPEFTETTIPKGLLKEHSTKTGTWALIRVLEGTLVYTIETPAHRQVLGANDVAAVVPNMPHSVAAQGPVRFYVEFFTKGPQAPDDPHDSQVV
jgi:tellurite resistance-related uncharacterized protein